MDKIISGGNAGARVQLLLRALHSRNYRLFFIGQSISLIGTWMQQVAMSWLVYRLTGSAFILGIVGFASQFPTFLLAPIAGVLADRWNRQRLLIITQTFAMLQAVALAVFVLTGIIQVWQIIALSSLLGLINAFDIPVRQSFVVDLVERKEDMGNAIALNSSIVNSARLIGPSIAGLLVASLGEGICFIINASSYLAVIIAIAAMRITPAEVRRQPKRLVHELREGFAYAYSFTPIRNILTLLALISLMGMPYAVLLPIFAKEVLHGGAHTFGFLMAASGIGALVSTIYLASRQSVLGLGKIIAASAGGFGLGIAGLAVSGNILFSLISLCLAGFGSMAMIASSNTILQTIVEDDKRGRVMSFFTMAFMGTTPFGSLIVGTAASRVGAQTTLAVGGIACLAGGIVFARKLPSMRELIRPIYRDMGIVPRGGKESPAAAEPPQPRDPPR